MTIVGILFAYLCDDWLDDDDTTFIVQASFIIDTILAIYLSVEH